MTQYAMMRDVKYRVFWFVFLRILIDIMAKSKQTFAPTYTPTDNVEFPTDLSSSTFFVTVATKKKNPVRIKIRIHSCVIELRRQCNQHDRRVGKNYVDCELQIDLRLFFFFLQRE